MLLSVFLSYRFRSNFRDKIFMNGWKKGGFEDIQVKESFFEIRPDNDQSIPR